LPLGAEKQFAKSVEGTELEEKATWRVKTGLAEMLKGGVIMDVTTPEQAKIA
jgi:pyridoxal biosynthesis lyase PdxS